jgi:DNA repair protein SbcC/Rad50
MKIDLKKITITNFKAIQSLVVLFSDVTNIFGENGTGKTTVLDAFLWLLFGKDSTDRKDFQIKTLDSNGEAYHNRDHEVAAVFVINGETIEIKRSFREKWTKKRGELKPVFSGHETQYFWNEVPMKMEEYESKIKTLVDESLFKLLTNVSYFNTRKWQDRRAILLAMAGTITNEEIFDRIITVQNKGNFISLINALNANKSVEDFKKEIANKKKRIKDELDLIPSRIDEATRSLPEEANYDVLESQLRELQSDLDAVETLINNATQAEKERQSENVRKLGKVQDLRRQLMDIEFAEKNKAKDARAARVDLINEIQREIKSRETELFALNSSITTEELAKAKLEKRQEELRKQWATVDAETLVFDEQQFCCPTCKRAYDESDIESKKEEMLLNFNTNKSTRLEQIVQDGKRLGTEIIAAQNTIASKTEERNSLQQKLADLKQELSVRTEENQRLSLNEDASVQTAIASNSEYALVSNQIKQIEAEVNSSVAASDNSSYIQRKRDITTSIDTIKQQLSSKAQRDRIQQRIDELKASEEQQSNELATLEGVEFSIEQYTKAKMDMLIEKINSKFSYVTFKMFDTQINGGQVECCETLINGVPYSDANTASKINAGLDIINTLSAHYGVYAPVFVDNAESVNTLLPINSQLVRLEVSLDKKLRVENSTEMAAVA